MGQNHGSYPLDDPGVRFADGAPGGNRTRLELLDRQAPAPAGLEGEIHERGDGAPGRMRTPHSTRPRIYRPLGSLVPEPAHFHHKFALACHAYSVFKEQKKKGLASPGPFW